MEWPVSWLIEQAARASLSDSLQTHAAMLTECQGAGDAAISPSVLILGSIPDHFTQWFQLLQTCHIC